MKKLRVILGAALVSASGLAQGTINFNNRVTGQVDAPVYAAPLYGVTWPTVGAGPTINAQLYRVSGTGATRTYSPIGQATTFREPTAANPLLTAYVVSISSMIVDNAAPGSQLAVVMRVWHGTSYETAITRGQSNLGEPITVTLGGDIPGAPTAVPGNLIGLQGMTLFIIPEPSTLALAILGSAALLFRRRK